MSDQFFGGRFITSDIVERTDKVSYSPLVNSDVFTDKVPVDAALIQETPMGGTVAAVSPLNEPVAGEIPFFETPDQQIPMGGTVAAVGPLDEALVHEAPVSETIPYYAPVGETITPDAPVSETITPDAPIVTSALSPAVLLDREDVQHFRTRWNEIQGKFVDEPRSAVQQADALVSEVSEQITQMFAKEHSSLEGQWKQGNDVSTEDLRMTLQHYRSFFNRLVV